MPAERRKSKRTKMVLPVKVTIDGVVHLAHTFDLTHNGARLGGVHVPLKQGQIIAVQRGPKKANFKIMWVQELGPKEFQGGIQAMDLHNNFWGVDLSEQGQHASGEQVMAMMAPKK